MGRSNAVRAFVLLVVIASSAHLYGEYHTYQTTSGTARYEAEMTQPLEQRDPLVPPRNGTVVVTTQSGRASVIGGDDGEIVAFDEKGRVLYFNQTANDYWDIDPLPEEDRIVYIATYPHSEGPGVVNAIETVDLRTGEVRRLYTNVTDGARWHDVDRLSRTEYAVADIDRDMVLVVNISTGQTIWAWDARSTYPPTVGGDPDGDWTHMNDVEELPNGDILASVRNMDQVVRIDREVGVLANWTLGRDDAHDILREQHNPDYIPAEQGGPSLLIADSDNDRIVEYARMDNGWRLTWTYDSGLSWPRDADRLPNGHTLITDTRNNRVIEIDEGGEVVWRISVHRPYEAERLDTGLESAGGPAFRRTELSDGSPGDGSGSISESTRGFGFRRFIWRIMPDPLIAAVRWVIPPWMALPEVAVVGGTIAMVVTWLGSELAIPHRLRSSIRRMR